jgi:hypothetical protein
MRHYENDDKINIATVIFLGIFIGGYWIGFKSPLWIRIPAWGMVVWGNLSAVHW